MHTRERKSLFDYFTKGEILLWCISVTLIVVSFLLFDRENYLTLIASFIGVTSLIFNAKGNPFGQFLMVIFSILYWGYIFYVCLLWGDDNLLGNDSSNGCFYISFMVEKSV